MRFNKTLYEKYKSYQRKQDNIDEAKLLLDRLRKQFGADDNPLPPVLGTLRRCNPFVFEELLLHAFDEGELKASRNRRYTGDGGIDGRFYLDDHLFLVQAKRYKSHINAADVEEFALKVKRIKAEFGVFIHTGKTGDFSKRAAWQSKYHLMIISGQSLVDLILRGNAETLLANHLKQTY